MLVQIEAFATTAIGLRKNLRPGNSGRG
jgi:hypothetical protein